MIRRALRLLSANRAEPPAAPLDDARARYRALRRALAGCLYALHKLRGQAARDRDAATRARAAAAAAFDGGAAPRARQLVALTADLLDAATLAERRADGLRVDAEAAAVELMRAAQAVRALELHGVIALADREAAGLAHLVGGDAASERLEVELAERALDAELRAS